MATPILRCRHCGTWYTVNHVVPEICPFCEQAAHWTTEGAPFVLTENDKRFLRGIHIKAEPDGKT
jgi:hypothetical protein